MALCHQRAISARQAAQYLLKVGGKGNPTCPGSKHADWMHWAWQNQCSCQEADVYLMLAAGWSKVGIQKMRSLAANSKNLHVLA